MPIIGHVDGIDGEYIVGWAASTDKLDNCDISVRAPDGNLIAEGRASRERSDLGVLRLGRINCGFRIRVGNIEQFEEVYIHADGIELANSPLICKTSMYYGHFEINSGSVSGWLSVLNSDSTLPIIYLSDRHGDVLVEDQDILVWKSSEDQSRVLFRSDLPFDCFSLHAAEFHVKAYANGYLFAERSGRLQLKGHLESIALSGGHGWLMSPDAKGKRFMLEVFRNGKLATKAYCDKVRVDVNASLGVPSDAKSGFHFDLDSSNMDSTEKVALISIRLPGSAEELFDGPFLCGSSASLIESTRQLHALLEDGVERLGAVHKTLFLASLKRFIQYQRESYLTSLSKSPYLRTDPPKLSIIVPVYRDLDVTRACINSLIATRDADVDVILVNDCSPEPGMSFLLHSFVRFGNVSVIENAENLGFIRSVNKAIYSCAGTDVLLVNSDTRMFSGGIREMRKVAYTCSSIGTVTAISNNATIFSYPHPSLRGLDLPDLTWDEAAEICIEVNSGKFVDVPTGHGFCLMIKQELFARLGFLDEAFGRGYGEENDFCNRAADLGYRNVASIGTFVEHRESVSFTSDKSTLLNANLARLESRYPEFTPLIMAAEQVDVLRSGRWALDRQRLLRAQESGKKFTAVICNGLGGGTKEAVSAIETVVGYGESSKLTLSARTDGYISLSVITPRIEALFSPDEKDIAISMIKAAKPERIIVHSLIGYNSAFISAISELVSQTHSIYYAHDFYPLCPRVTMIDARGKFCNFASPPVCDRCVEIGGAHEFAKLDGLTVEEHRDLFAKTLNQFSDIIAPSHSTVRYYEQANFPRNIHVIEHPDPESEFPPSARSGNVNEIVLFGAIGPHKGSQQLLQLAQHAKMTNPELRFHVIGFSDIDDYLLEVGNVTISGPYKKSQLSSLSQMTRGRVALFLHIWPETFSYTLSEAAKLGFFPLVPDIGAPAERVKTSGFGMVFPFPIQLDDVLRSIEHVAQLEENDNDCSVGPDALRSKDADGIRTSKIYKV